MRCALLSLVFTFAIVPFGPRAAAQAASDADMSAARELFGEGLEAARAERWEDARRAFERSYEIVPRNSTLLNLAGAQAETGQLVAAQLSYRRFLDRAGPPERHLLDSAEEALARVDARVARVTIGAPGLAEDDELWLDDDVLSHGSVGVPLPVDPGAHLITVARDGLPAGEARFTVAEGEATAVEVAVATPAAETLTTSAEPSDAGESGESIWTSPWLWGGVALVVVAAIVIPVVIATTGDPREPYAGNLGAGTLTF